MGVLNPFKGAFARAVQSLLSLWVSVNAPVSRVEIEFWSTGFHWGTRRWKKRQVIRAVVQFQEGLKHPRE